MRSLKIFFANECIDAEKKRKYLGLFFLDIANKEQLKLRLFLVTL